MKKLITLLSLTMAMTAFGASQGNTENNENMTITAQVIQPLTVKADKNLDFGKIIQGNTATANSTFTITGEAKENITVIIPETVQLSNEIAKSSLNVEIVSLLPHNLGNSGSTIAGITGTIVTAADTPTGTYTGEFTAQVRYN